MDRYGALEAAAKVAMEERKRLVKGDTPPKGEGASSPYGRTRELVCFSAPPRAVLTTLPANPIMRSLFAPGYQPNTAAVTIWRRRGGACLGGGGAAAAAAGLCAARARDGAAAAPRGRVALAVPVASREQCAQVEQPLVNWWRRRRRL